MVHKEACLKSPVLESAISDLPEIEEGVQPYALNDVAPETFRKLVQWLYQDCFLVIQLNKEHTAPGSGVSAQQKRDEDMTLVLLWILAEHLHLPRLQNMVIDAMDTIIRLTKTLPSSTYHYIYRATSNSPESQLRKYTVASAVYYMDLETLTDKNKEPEIPRSLLVVLAIDLWKARFYAKGCQAGCGPDVCTCIVPKEGPGIPTLPLPEKYYVSEEEGDDVSSSKLDNVQAEMAQIEDESAVE